MRLAFILATTLMVYACSDATQKNQNPGDGSQIPPSGISKIDKEQAAKFISSKFESVKLQNFEWSASKASLKDSLWSWSEYSVNRRDQENFRFQIFIVDLKLNPKNLFYPVHLSKTDDGLILLKFECAVSACIEVNGAHSFALVGYEKDPLNGEVHQKRDAGEWFFNNSETAERVARAMNDLIETQGGRKSKY